MDNILITGASGLLGSYLSNFLESNNYKIIHLSRSRKSDRFRTFIWDIEKEYIETEALDNIDHIIHLAGAGIADKRWSEKRKKEIIDSRVRSTNLLFSKISQLNTKPKTFISASAIGYYGAITTNKIFEESDSPGSDFQANVCKLWEESANQFNDLDIRTAILRFGVILSKKGGALKKLLLPTKLGLGAAIGSGEQYFPWIHIQDVAEIIHKTITDTSISGNYNLVSPSHNTNYEFSKTLAQVLDKPFFMPNIPSFLLKLAFGEMSQILLEGSRISCDKITSAGYNFTFGNLEDALKDLLN